MTIPLAAAPPLALPFAVAAIAFTIPYCQCSCHCHPVMPLILPIDALMVQVWLAAGHFIQQFFPAANATDASVVRTS
jgi:hypothetical protein